MHSSTKVQPEQRFWLKGGLVLGSTNRDILNIKVSNYDIFFLFLFFGWGGVKGPHFWLGQSVWLLFLLSECRGQKRTLEVCVQH